MVNLFYKEQVIGNIFEKDIFEKWEKIVSNENYLQNIKNTFNARL